jgi:hypothetical protein
MPTEAKPHPATSSYLKAPSAIKPSPTIIIIKVAQANTVFLFIPILLRFGFWYSQISEFLNEILVKALNFIVQKER